MRNIYNYGTYIEGDVYGRNVLNGDENIATSNTAVYINDPLVIQQLLTAAENIKPQDPTAKEKVQELKRELKTECPRTGKLQALYDWLRRNCTVDNTLKAIKVFGELLIKAMSLG